MKTHETRVECRRKNLLDSVVDKLRAGAFLPLGRIRCDRESRFENNSVDILAIFLLQKEREMSWNIFHYRAKIRKYSRSRDIRIKNAQRGVRIKMRVKLRIDWALASNQYRTKHRYAPKHLIIAFREIVHSARGIFGYKIKRRARASPAW